MVTAGKVGIPQVTMVEGVGMSEDISPDNKDYYASLREEAGWPRL